MSSRRMARINQLLKEVIGQSLFRVVTEPAFDAGAVTVTHVITGSDLRNARVLVSINRPDEEEKRRMLLLLASHRKAFQQLIAGRVIMKYTPHLTFELDESLAQGDHVLGVIAQIEAQHPDWPVRPASDTPDDPS